MSISGCMLYIPTVSVTVSMVSRVQVKFSVSLSFRMSMATLSPFTATLVFLDA